MHALDPQRRLYAAPGGVRRFPPIFGLLGRGDGYSVNHERLRLGARPAMPPFFWAAERPTLTQIK